MRHATFHHIAEEWEGLTYMFPLGSKEENPAFFSFSGAYAERF